MTVSTTKNRINQLANGVQTVFLYDFIVQDASHMKVYFDDVLQATGYTVNGVGNPAGGDVTFDVAPDNGVTVTLQRIIPLTQLVDYLPFDPFPAETHEGALDKLTLEVQQVSDEISRAIKAAVSTPEGTSYTLPSPEVSSFLQWNLAEDGFINVNISTLGDFVVTTPYTELFLTAVDAPAARTTLDVYSKAEVDQAESDIFSESLVKLIHPDESKGLQELQAQGVYPSSFNQQWGGMGYGGLPDGTLGEIATGYIRGSSNSAVAHAVSTTYKAHGFKVGQTTDVASVWVKIFKTGDPTNNLELYIYDDSAGDPNAVITNGTATSQDGHLHTDNTDGEWVKFVFATVPSCTGGTQYHIVLKSSGAVDGSNYWNWLDDSVDATYPHGNHSSGDATPTWTPDTARNLQFLVEPVTTIMTSGLANFDGALLSYEGLTLDQSGGLYFKNADLNHKRGTIHIAGSGWDISKVFYDSGLNTDSNRIVIGCDGSGIPFITLYENDETKHEIIDATTDITSGNHIVSIRYRTEGDGSDFLTLYVDGVSEGTALTLQTFTLDRAFEDGHTHIGGGFPVAPTWTDDQDMSVLPSASGWAWTGTATESAAMAVNGGILSQNGGGYLSTDTGRYDITPTLDNSTGWAVETKIKVLNDSNTVVTYGAAELGSMNITIIDGTKRFEMSFHEYFLQIGEYAVSDGFFIQHDFTKETTVKIIGKGSDYFIFLDGKLVVDGTGLLTVVSASNLIRFGDSSDTTQDLTTTAEWHYFKYYEGAHLPEYSTQKLSELANWNDDKSALLDIIYNAGSIQSVKALAGMNDNYVKSVKQVISVKGITSSPTTTSTSYIPLNELQVFSFGSDIKASAMHTPQVNGVVASGLSISIDGVRDIETNVHSAVSGLRNNLVVDTYKNLPASLKYISADWLTSSGTVTSNQTRRNLIVEAE